MDQETKADIAEIKKRVIRIERYFFWTAVITVAAIILPLIGLLFAAPKLLHTYTDIQNLGL